MTRTQRLERKTVETREAVEDWMKRLLGQEPEREELARYKAAEAIRDLREYYARTRPGRCQK